MADVFLSYASEDREVAQHLAERLQAHGLSVWWDRELYAGSDFTAEIQRELDSASAVVVLWSKTSVGSAWVRDEAAYARDKNRLIPVRLDATEPPLGFRQLHTIELSRWRGETKSPSLSSIVNAIAHANGRKEPVGTLAQSAPAKNRPMIFGALVLLVGLLVAAVWTLSVRVQPEQQGRGRVFVRPLDTIAEDADTSRFANLMSQNLKRLLSLNDVHVTSSDVDAPEFELRGTVNGDETSYVVSVEIVNRPNDAMVWSLSMRRARAEAVPFGEQLATRVADIVKCALDYRSRLGDLESLELLRVLIQDCEAESGISPIEQLPRLADEIQRLVPDSAGAYGFCAGANAAMTTVGAIDKPASEIARLRVRATECANRALELDSGMFSAYWALAIVDDPSRTLAERERLLTKSIDLEREWPYASFAYAVLLDNVGRIREARVKYEQLASEFPYRYRTLQWRLEAAVSAAELGRLDVARPEFERIMAVWPESSAGRQWHGMEHFWGDPKIARKLADEGKFIAPNNRPCLDAFLDARIAGKSMREAEISEACAAGFHRRPEEIYGYFGHADAAFREIRARLKEEAAISTFMRRQHYLYYRSYMRSVWSDPRFMEIAAELGYVRYWLETDQWPDFCQTKDLPYDCKDVARTVLAIPSKKTP